MSSGPLIGLASMRASTRCRLCERNADLVECPSGDRNGEVYAYCARCVSAALERFDMDHPTVNGGARERSS